MSVYSKIRKNIPVSRPMNCDHVTVPSMAYTPKQILERFVTSDLSLAVHEPSDDIVDVLTNDQFDNMPTDSMVDPYEFEDKFDAMEHIAEQNQNPVFKSKIRKESKSNEDSDNSGDSGDHRKSDQQPPLTPEEKGDQGEDNSRG